MKKKGWILFSGIVLSCGLIVVTFLLYHHATSYDFQNPADLIKAMESAASKSVDSPPLAVKQQGDFGAILYQEGERNQLLLLKKNGLTGRYSTWGGASTDSKVGLFQTVDFKGGMVVVYGNNKNIGATSYSISDGEEVLVNENLGDTILDIYFPEKRTAATFVGSLYKGDEVLRGLDDMVLDEGADS